MTDGEEQEPPHQWTIRELSKVVSTLSLLDYRPRKRPWRIPQKRAIISPLRFYYVTQPVLGRSSSTFSFSKIWFEPWTRRSEEGRVTRYRETLVSCNCLLIYSDLIDVVGERCWRWGWTINPVQPVSWSGEGRPGNFTPMILMGTVSRRLMIH